MNLDYTISHINTNFKFLFMEILFPYCLDSGTGPLRTATPRPEL